MVEPFRIRIIIERELLGLRIADAVPCRVNADIGVGLIDTGDDRPDELDFRYLQQCVVTAVLGDVEPIGQVLEAVRESKFPALEALVERLTNELGERYPGVATVVASSEVEILWIAILRIVGTDDDKAADRLRCCEIDLNPGRVLFGRRPGVLVVVEPLRVYVTVKRLRRTLAVADAESCAQHRGSEVVDGGDFLNRIGVGVTLNEREARVDDIGGRNAEFGKHRMGADGHAQSGANRIERSYISVEGGQERRRCVGKNALKRLHGTQVGKARVDERQSRRIGILHRDTRLYAFVVCRTLFTDEKVVGYLGADHDHLEEVGIGHIDAKTAQYGRRDIELCQRKQLCRRRVAPGGDLRFQQAGCQRCQRIDVELGIGSAVRGTGKRNADIRKRRQDHTAEIGAGQNIPGCKTPTRRCVADHSRAVVSRCGDFHRAVDAKSRITGNCKCD